jgi:hypothetical protein
VDDIDELNSAHDVELEEIEDRLQCFIYLLVRDRVPLTAVTEIIKEIENSEDHDFVFTSKGLAHIGREMAQRLMGRRSAYQEHEWVKHPTEAGMSTVVEHCWLCGTLRLSDGGSPQDGYEYFEAGVKPQRHLVQPKGIDHEPHCIQAYERITP